MPAVTEQLDPGVFVIRPTTAKADGEDLARLATKASIEPLRGASPGWIVRLNKAPRSIRAAWRELHRLLGADYVVLPAVLDDRGHARYPTGLLSLRLGGDADDAALRAIARTHGLELVARAQFSRQQALFRPNGGSDVFLPDLSQRIAGDAQIEAVWFDAESAYSRT